MPPLKVRHAKGRRKTKPKVQEDEVVDEPGLSEPCWQCELDIGHICYSGIPNAKWGQES